jgi:hypothetical protein
MSDYPGRIIRATAPTVTSNAASGVWTLEEAMQYKQAGTWPTQVIADPNFKQTVLLLHGDGTNGAQNNTFLDGSTNNFTITRNGNTTQGTFSPFSVGAGEWSNFFDGTTDWISMADNTAFTMGTGDFTIEYWGYVNAASDSRAFGQVNSTPALSTLSIYGGIDGSAKAVSGAFVGTTDYRCTSTNNYPLGQWVHHALVRDGSTLRQYINGVQDGTSNISTNSVNDSSAQFSIGRVGEFNSLYWNGYISNVRLVKGTCLYPSGISFTPPTAPLANITNTSLLTCQSNRFVDNSTNAFAITRNGDVRVTPFSPFAPSAAYSASTNGGSGYFDESGDWLSLPSNSALEMGAGDFTWEFWMYPITTADNHVLAQQSFEITVQFASSATNRFVVYDGTTRIIGTIDPGQWTHFALTRTGSTLQAYINGVASGSSWTNSSSTRFTLSSGLIGARWGSTNSFNGYVSNVRIVKGTAVYTSAFTPPTAPFTAITNTSLLCNFTNAGIFDNTGKNNLETVGNAQIDTTTKKYGTGSMEFDGTGDRLIIPPTQDLDLTTGDFTVEAWIYTNTIAAGVAVFAYRGSTAVTLSTDIQWSMYRNGSSLIVRPYSSTTDYTINIGTIAANTWYHVAFTRSGSTFRGFLNGTVSATTQTISGSLNNNATWSGSIIGSMTEGVVDRGFNGYIDDLRITKGVARYTSNFTPPTLAFQDQ